MWQAKEGLAVKRELGATVEQSKKFEQVQEQQEERAGTGKGRADKGATQVGDELFGGGGG